MGFAPPMAIAGVRFCADFLLFIIIEAGTIPSTCYGYGSVSAGIIMSVGFLGGASLTFIFSS